MPDEEPIAPTDHQDPTARTPPPLSYDLGLTILAHPYLERVGQVASSPPEVAPGKGNKEWRISRYEPNFWHPDRRDAANSLEQKKSQEQFKNFVSETRALLISWQGKGPDARVEIRLEQPKNCACQSKRYHTLYALPSSRGEEHEPPATKDPGEQALCEQLWPVHEPRLYIRDELRRGIVLLFSRHVAFVLHEWHQFDAVDLELSKLFRSFEGSSLSKHHRFRHFVGESNKFRALRRRLANVANAKSKGRLAPVVLFGESGVGKMPAAQVIHLLAKRRGNWLNENMSSPPSDPAFIRTRLFGRVDGKERQKGLVDRAHEGTLVFDEIGNASFEYQEILLNFAEDGVVRPEGGADDHPVDTRIIAATNKGEAALKGDLLARFPLSQRIHLPPLRERREDVGRLLLAILRWDLRERDTDETDSPPEGRSRWVELLEQPSAQGPWLTAEVVAAWASLPLHENARVIEGLATHLVSSCAEEAKCELGTESLLQLFEATLRGLPHGEGGGPPPPKEPLTVHNILARFEEAGWKMATLVAGQSTLTPFGARRLLKEAHYPFLNERTADALQKLKKLEPQGNAAPVPTQLVVDTLQADMQTIRKWLTHLDKHEPTVLASAGLDAAWLEYLRHK